MTSTDVAHALGSGGGSNRRTAISLRKYAMSMIRPMTKAVRQKTERAQIGVCFSIWSINQSATLKAEKRCHYGGL